MQKINKRKKKSISIQKQLLVRYLILLVVLLFVLSTYQYVSMKNYLYKDKAKDLYSRFSNIDRDQVMGIKDDSDIKKNTEFFLKQISDTDVCVIVINSEGNEITYGYDHTVNNGVRFPMQRCDIENFEKVNNDIGHNGKLEGNEKLEAKEKIHNDENTSTITPSSDSKNYKEITNGTIDDTDNTSSSGMAAPHLSVSEYLEILKDGNDSNRYKVIKDIDGRNQIVIWNKFGDEKSPSGIVQISTYVDSADQILYIQLKVFAISAILVLIIGVILGLSIFKHTLKPLKQMGETIDNIDKEQLEVRLTLESGQIEIDKLSENFNRMLDRLEKSFIQEKATNSKMRSFVLDASHELRTPLTAIKGFVEVLQMGASKNEKHLDLALESMRIESDRLTDLVNNLIILTKIDEKISIETKRIDISEVIKEIEGQLIILSGKRKLEFKLQENVYSIINRDQIKQVFYNLVQNAINYTDENDGKITISNSLEIIDNIQYVVIKVQDNGEGIKEENLEFIFNRFFKGDTERADKKGTYGLGLSIVKSIIDYYKGDIEVDSKLGNGTTFTVYLLYDNNI